jgi:hypothetical protein
MPGFPNARTRRAPITALALALALLPAGAAHAASAPVITKVSPMKVEIGQTLTIKGRGFRSGAFKNTVAFKRSRKPAVFVKVPTATRTQLTFPVPEKLLPFLQDAKGKAITRQFRLRVLSNRFGKAFTSAKLSPRVGPPGSGGGGTPPPGAAPACKAVLTSETTDTDKDGLSDALETRVKTNPCALDSDGEGVSDGFEYESALDLNSRALPYPGKRQWPNPLDGSDAAYDFDQDGLTMTDEYAQWMYSTGGRFPLTYSDGDQDTNVGGNDTPVTPETAALDINGNGVITDDEKDVDGDAITNWDETSGRMQPQWWAGAHPGEIQYEGNVGAAPLFDTSPVDPDSDGDGQPDGADDQDHDGWTNVDETNRLRDFGAGVFYWVHPYNPCLPDYLSRACTLHPPFANAWAPFGNGPLGPSPLNVQVVVAP